jgi:hypothetical protein
MYDDDYYYGTENIVKIKKIDYIYVIFLLFGMITIVPIFSLIMMSALCMQSITCPTYEICENIINRIKCV